MSGEKAEFPPAVDGELVAMQWTTGDHRALQEIVDQSDATTTPSLPSLASYLHDLASRAADHFSTLLPSVWPNFFEGGVAAIADSVVKVVWALAVIAIAVFAAKLLVQGRWRVGLPQDEPVSENEVVVDHESWADKFTTELHQGDPREALTSLWWCMCERLQPPGNERVLTGSELIKATGRHDLSKLIADFEQLLYGGRDIARVDAVELAARLDLALKT